MCLLLLLLGRSRRCSHLRVGSSTAGMVDLGHEGYSDAAVVTVGVLVLVGIDVRTVTVRGVVALNFYCYYCWWYC